MHLAVRIYKAKMMGGRWLPTCALHRQLQKQSDDQFSCSEVVAEQILFASKKLPLLQRLHHHPESGMHSSICAVYTRTTEHF